MRKENKIEVNQKVWVKELWRQGSPELKEDTVIKVGKKFFEVESGRGRFYIETLLQDGKGYSSRYQVYIDRKVFEDEMEAYKFSCKIRNVIGQYGDIKLPLKTLKAIWEAISNSQA